MEALYGLKGGQQAGHRAELATERADQWTATLKLVADEYPFCTMHGVHIEDGCIVAYEGVQISFVFGENLSAARAEPRFDANWQALKALCAKIKFGRLAELRFSEGRPVGAKVNAGGRRLRRLAPKAVKERGPMS